MARWSWDGIRRLVGGACLVVGVVLHTLSVFTRHWVATPLYTLSLFYNCSHANGACAKPFQDEPGIADGVQITIVTFTVVLWALLGRGLPLGSREVTKVTCRRLKHAALALTICATYLIIHVTTVFGSHTKGGNYGWSFHTEVAALVFAVVAIFLTVLGDSSCVPGNHVTSYVHSAPSRTTCGCSYRPCQTQSVAPAHPHPSRRPRDPLPIPHLQPEATLLERGTVDEEAPGTEGSDLTQRPSLARGSFRFLASFFHRVFPCTSDHAGERERRAGQGGRMEECRDGRIYRQAVAGIGRPTRRAQSLFRDLSRDFADTRVVSEDETVQPQQRRSPRSPDGLRTPRGEYARIPDTIIQTYKDSCTPKAYRLNRDRLGSRRKTSRRTAGTTSASTAAAGKNDRTQDSLSEARSATPSPSGSKTKHSRQQKHRRNDSGQTTSTDRVLGRREEKRRREGEEETMGRNEESGRTRGRTDNRPASYPGDSSGLQDSSSHTYVNLPRMKKPGPEFKRTRSFSQREKAVLGPVVFTPDKTFDQQDQSKPLTSTVARPDGPSAPGPVLKDYQAASSSRRDADRGLGGDAKQDSSFSAISSKKVPFLPLTKESLPARVVPSVGDYSLERPVWPGKSSTNLSPYGGSRAKLSKTETFTVADPPRRPKKKPRKKTLESGSTRRSPKSLAENPDSPAKNGPIRRETDIGSTLITTQISEVVSTPKADTTDNTIIQEEDFKTPFSTINIDDANESAEFSVEDHLNYTLGDVSDAARTMKSMEKTQTQCLEDISQRQQYLQGQSASSLLPPVQPQIQPKETSPGQSPTAGDCLASPALKTLESQSLAGADHDDGDHDTAVKEQAGQDSDSAAGQEREIGDGQSDHRESTSPRLSLQIPLDSLVTPYGLSPLLEDSALSDGEFEQKPVERARLQLSAASNKAPHPFVDASLYSLQESKIVSRSLDSIRSMYKTPSEGLKTKTAGGSVALEPIHSEKSIGEHSITSSSMPLPIENVKIPRDQASANRSTPNMSYTETSVAASSIQNESKPKSRIPKRPAPGPPTNKTPPPCVSKLEFNKSDNSVNTQSGSFLSIGIAGDSLPASKGSNSISYSDGHIAVPSLRPSNFQDTRSTATTKIGRPASAVLNGNVSYQSGDVSRKRSPQLNASAQSLKPTQPLNSRDTISMSRSMDSVMEAKKPVRPAGFYRDRFLSLMEPETRQEERKMFRTTQL